MPCLLLLCLTAAGDAVPLPDGPLHEGFAEALVLGGVDAVAVAEPPPPAVRERPPVKPTGRDVRWVGGYWGREAGEYVWVTGGWRDAPQGQTWHPGGWSPVEGRWRRTPGVWAASLDETPLPKPPPARDAGPTSDPPSPGHFWVPGVWRYRPASADFAWRAGYWQPGVEDFRWVPARYRPSPRGYVSLGGYWDYRPALRGAAFAAVRFPRGTPDLYRPTTPLSRSQLRAAAATRRYSYRPPVLPLRPPAGVSPVPHLDASRPRGLTPGRILGVQREAAISGEPRLPFAAPRAGGSVQRYRDFLQARPPRVRGVDRVRGAARF